jgi:hypothetical protein
MAMRSDPGARQRRAWSTTLSEAETDQAIELLRNGVSTLELRTRYGFATQALRKAVRARGLSVRMLRIQSQAEHGDGTGAVAFRVQLGGAEERAVRAYAARHEMTISDVLRAALHTHGVFD